MRRQLACIAAVAATRDERLPLGASARLLVCVAAAAADPLPLQVDTATTAAARRDFKAFAKPTLSGDEVFAWAEASSYRDHCSDDDFAAAWEAASPVDDLLDAAAFERFVAAADAAARRNAERAPPSLAALAKGMLKSRAPALIKRGSRRRRGS